METTTKRASIVTAAAGAVLLALVSVDAQYIARRIGADAWGYDALIWIGARLSGPVTSLAIILLSAITTGAATLFASAQDGRHRLAERYNSPATTEYN